MGVKNLTMELQPRQTAYKVWIQSIVNGKLCVTSDEFSPNYVIIGDQKVSRVNLIADVVELFVNADESFASVTIDDGSAEVQVRAFQEDVNLFAEINPGDLVLVIGKVREYQEELYVLPEIVKKISDPNWMVARKLELMKRYGKPVFELPVYAEENHEEKMQENEILIEERGEEDQQNKRDNGGNKKQEVLGIIKRAGEGVNTAMIAVVSSLSEDEVEQVLLQLVKEGEIYQHKPNSYKAI